MVKFLPISFRPRLWLPSDSLVESDGAPMTVWRDISGNGLHATVALGTPTVKTGVANGRRAMNFAIDPQSGATTPSLSLTGDYTMFLVSKNSGSGRTLSTNNMNWLLGSWGGMSIACYNEGWLISSDPTPDLQFKIHALTVKNYSDSTYEVNGQQVAQVVTTSSVAPDKLQLNFWEANKEPTDVQIADLLVFPVALSISERTLIVQFLKRYRP